MTPASTQTPSRARKVKERTSPSGLDALMADAPAALVKPASKPLRKQRQAMATASPCKAPSRAAAPIYMAGQGVGSVRFAMPDHERAVIDAALTILGGHLRESNALMNSPDLVREYLCLHLGAEMRELFTVLYLNSQHRLIAFEVAAVGTLGQTSVYPREIVKAALLHEAASVILAHNHPSGSVQPSKADIDLTHTLRHALSWVDVRLLDHFIVGGGQAASLAEKNLI